MKNVYYFLGVIIMVFITISCSDDDQAMPPTASFVAQIDGEQFTATNAFAYISASNYLVIAGIDESTGGLIHFYSPAMEGTYDQEIFMAYKHSINGPLFYNKNEGGTDLTGSIALTSLSSNTASGQFEFTGVNFSHGLLPKEISGTFSNIPILDSFPSNLMGWPASTPSYINAAVNSLPFYFEHATVSTEAGIKTIAAVSYPAMRTIEVSFPENIAAGTYEFGDEGTGNISAKFGYYGVDAVATGGTITVMDNTETGIDATFSFTATDANGNTHNVTDGYLHLVN